MNHSLLSLSNLTARVAFNGKIVEERNEGIFSPVFSDSFFLMGITLFFSSGGSNSRQSIADNFLEGLKKRELTAQNAVYQYEKYGIYLSSLCQVGSSGKLSKGDIYFPIALLDYKYLSEEAIPRGIVTYSLRDIQRSLARGGQDPDGDLRDLATKIFNKLRAELERKNARDLKIDEVNKTITYYDETPESFKLYYLITVTNQLGAVLKKSAFIRIKDNQIVEFKY